MSNLPDPSQPLDESPDVTARQASADTGSQPRRLVRALGPWMAIAVVVGYVIGSGIYLKPGTIAGDGRSFGLIIAVWVAGGILCILGALCFAELATMMPRAGGLYVYLREAYGRPVGFLFGWTEFLIRVPGSISALAVVFVGQFVAALELDLSEFAQVALIALIISGMAWINILGVLWGGRMQLAVTTIKAGTLAAIVLAPFVLTPFVEQGLAAENYATSIDAPPSESDSLPSTAAQIGAVLIAVMWAYNGWHGITPLAEEVRRPQRNIPLALFGGIGILILLYLGANFAYHGVLSMQEVREIGLRNEADGGTLVRWTAAGEMLYKLIGPFGRNLIALVIMCSVFGAINTNLLAGPRITFAMGRDRVFFQNLGRVHATYRTPVFAILATAAMAVGMVVVVAIAKSFVRDLDASQYQPEFVSRMLVSLQDGTIFDLMTNFVVFAVSVFYTLAVLAVIVLRIRRPEMRRRYRTWGYPIVPALFIAVYAWFLTQIFFDKPLEAGVGLGLIAIGLPVYFAFQGLSRSRGNEIN